MKVRGLLHDRRLSFGFRLILAAVLIAASIGKLADPRAFADSLSAYALFPAAAVAPAAVVLPWIELGVGLALAAGIPARSAGLLATVLSTGYVVAIAAALVRGLNVSCGCFGAASSAGPLRWVDLAWRVVMLAAALQVLAAEDLVAQPARLLVHRRT